MPCFLSFGICLLLSARTWGSGPSQAWHERVLRGPGNDMIHQEKQVISYISKCQYYIDLVNFHHLSAFYSGKSKKMPHLGINWQYYVILAYLEMFIDCCRPSQIFSNLYEFYCLQYRHHWTLDSEGKYGTTKTKMEKAGIVSYLYVV